jgi:2-succinyl-5-enolpyruvyl-6-hydroxy-3-cyclohexene-1-carboxylate synthase
MLRAEPGALADALADAAAGAPRTEAGWLAGWSEADAIAGEALDAGLAEIDARGEPFEGAAARALAVALPEGGTLVCGNSMPVRDVDSLLPALARPLRVVGTRGAAGIDGVASTAAGAAVVAAEEGAGPVGLLVGDLSFLHDLTGLWAVRRHELSLTVVLINNDGGGIFHFLPQREELPALFEQWFGTPGALDAAAVAALFGGRHAELPAGAEAMREAIADVLGEPGLTVLELRTDRDRNVELHRELWAHVGAALRAGRAAAGSGR